MAIPALPVCELEQLDLPCLSLFEEGETMLDRIFARISEYLNVGCEGLRAFIAHSEPVTTESDWIATWFIGETERFGSAAGLNTIMPIPETEVRWGFKMVESGFSFPFTRAPEGLTSLDLDLAHAQARVLYSHGALLRSAIKSLCPDGLLPESCTRARLIDFGPAIAGEDALAGTAGWKATIGYVRVG